MVLGALGLALGLAIVTPFSLSGTGTTGTATGPISTEAFFDPGPSDDTLPDEYFPLVPQVRYLEAAMRLKPVAPALISTRL